LVSKPIQYFLMTSDWKRDVTGLLATAEHPLIVVLGPTASGKTAFSIALAKSIVSTGREAEIINADSRQLYRYLNIGTAKVTPKEMQGISHHLIDVLDPKEEAAAGWYQGEARRVIRNMQKRGVVPVLVGGSMLYVSSVIDALTLAPVPDPALRARLIEEYDQDGGATLFARLQEIDPETADSIHRNNKPHLVRAVEIYELLKAPKSEAVPQMELRSDANVSEYDLLIFGMQWDREELCARIDARTQKMFEEGWLEEVEDRIHQAGGSATIAPLDLIDGESIGRLAQAIGGRWDALDILVLNAATLGALAAVPAIDAKEFARLLTLNIAAPQALIAAFVQFFCLMNISSPILDGSSASVRRPRTRRWKAALPSSHAWSDYDRLGEGRRHGSSKKHASAPRSAESAPSFFVL